MPVDPPRPVTDWEWAALDDLIAYVKASKTPGENPGEENPEGPGGTGTGELLIDGVAFFDPERGYVKCGEVRAEYKEIMQKALQEGTISQEEWEYIMETYFADLGVKKED